MVLEMLLCQQEEPANISTKLKEVDRMLENKEKTEEGKAQARKLQVNIYLSIEKAYDHSLILKQNLATLNFKMV